MCEPKCDVGQAHIPIRLTIAMCILILLIIFINSREFVNNEKDLVGYLILFYDYKNMWELSAPRSLCGAIYIFAALRIMVAPLLRLIDIRGLINR